MKINIAHYPGNVDASQRVGYTHDAFGMHEAPPARLIKQEIINIIPTNKNNKQ